jgi:hypothetical protein
MNRDWLTTNALDRDCLWAAKRETDRLGGGTWLPWRGMYARAQRLCKKGLLREAGTAAMSPHKLYIITVDGRDELAVAQALSPADPAQSCSLT